MTNFPQNGHTAYNLITGSDDDQFRERVSEALLLGYKLYGSPTISFNGQTIIIAQALIWPTNEGRKRDSDEQNFGQNFSDRQPRRNFRERSERSQENPRHNSRRFSQKDSGRGFGDDSFKSAIKRFDEDNNFKKHLSRSNKSKTPKW